MTCRSLLLSVFLLVHCVMISQEIDRSVTCTAGQTDTLGQCYLDWTIGEVVISTLTDNSCILSQGFHQPYYQVTEIQETDDPQMRMRIYPNPTEDVLNIEFPGSTQQKSYLIIIYDQKGSVLLRTEQHHRQVQLHLKSFPQGLMVMKIIEVKTRSARTFKIVKITH